jgi:hypothetical protein
MLAPVLRAGYAQIRQLPLFDGLPNDLLIQTLASGDLTWRQVDRDVILADPASAAGVAPAGDGAGQPARSRSGCSTPASWPSVVRPSRRSSSG